MVPETQFALALLSVLVLLSVIFSLFGCVCGCRKTTPKNELMGLAGMVKLTNPDENVNFSTAPPVVQFNSVAASAEQLVICATEINKRGGAGGAVVGAGAVSSATRSLPDLPVDPTGGRAAPDWEPAADTGSDLYATVEDNKLGRTIGQKRVGLPRDSTIESSYDSPSQTDNSLSPYARVKREHPYDQVKQTADEHPYAQVRANGKVGLSHVQDNLAGPSQSPSSSSTEGTDSPVAPPRARKSLSDSQASSVSSVVNIPAASAIAGGVPASLELPYMTPPLPPPTAPHAQQQHFSGDSQDSSKGYTSISVREPLSKIRDQVVRRQEMADPHYATVSDDSDEMYAAIEDPNLYTSGSETYAQIQPKAQVAPEMAPVASVVAPQPPAAVAAGTSGRTGENLQPPIYDKQHSRQGAALKQSVKKEVEKSRNLVQISESVSSGGSSNVSPASPKPEKRQANSPLPRPPDPNNPNHTLNPNPPSVDDMYAKVMKKRRSSHSVSSVDQEPADSQPPSLPGYETVLRPQGEQSENSSAPGYETVANSCGNESTTLSCGYETVADHDSLVPGYERVAGGRDCDRPPSESSEPNYEELRPQQTYATVDKKRKTLRQNSSEPDYASLSRRDRGYEQVEGFNPNYESSDPNYESVERQEPPYERVAAYTPVYDQASGSRDEGLRVEEVYSKVNKQRSVAGNR